MKIYIVTMYRDGDKHSHSYVIGAYTTKNSAIVNGNTEVLWRGYKYYPEVVELGLDEAKDIDTVMTVVVTTEQFRYNTYEFDDERYEHY